MIRVRRIALVALVWLTSGLTVIAGVPEIVCQCAKGNSAPNSRTDSRSACGCNCGGQCCAARIGSCCQSAQLSKSQIGSRGVSRFVAHPGQLNRIAGVCSGQCKRSLSTNLLPLSDRGKKPVSNDLASKSSPFAEKICDVLPNLINLQPANSIDRSAHFSSKLITALQHFNI